MDQARRDQAKRVPPGAHQRFLEEVLALARKYRYTALSIRVTAEDQTTTQMDWRAPVDELLEVFPIGPSTAE